MLIRPQELIWLGEKEVHEIKVTLTPISRPGEKVEPIQQKIHYEQQPILARWLAALLVLILIAPCLWIYLFRIPITWGEVDKRLARLPAYGILNPTETPTATATPTATETATPTATETATPAPTATPTVNMTLVASLVTQAPPLPTPTDFPPTDTPTPLVTPTDAPVANDGVYPCYDGSSIVITGSGPTNVPIGLYFDNERVDLGANPADGVRDPTPITIDASGRFTMTLNLVGVATPRPYRVEVRSLAETPVTFRSFICNYPGPNVAPTVTPTPTITLPPSPSRTPTLTPSIVP